MVGFLYNLSIRPHNLFQVSRDGVQHRLGLLFRRSDKLVCTGHLREAQMFAVEPLTDDRLTERELSHYLAYCCYRHRRARMSPEQLAQMFPTTAAAMEVRYQAELAEEERIRARREEQGTEQLP